MGTLISQHCSCLQRMKQADPLLDTIAACVTRILFRSGRVVSKDQVRSALAKADAGTVKPTRFKVRLASPLIK